MGSCNSFELHKIIEKINPEIIFEELSKSNYDNIYKAQSLITVESNAIKLYLQSHSIEHIPVDTFNLPISYDENVGLMLRSLTDSPRSESIQLRRFLDHQASLMYHGGFNFLNSDQNDEFMERIHNQREKILNIISVEWLFMIANLEKEVIDKRENVIIDNIYIYSEEHVYNQAILFIGAGHRKAMIKKIEERKAQEKIKINWILHND
jgi:pheromone shutdown protein TraB